MGVPIYWLSEHFPLEPPVDGRYFMDRLASANGAALADPPRPGPRKAPDFVTRDTSGVWHVIECKGTQTGNAYRKRQLGALGPPGTGAVAQKRTISFPSALTGQRLACGLVLAVEGGHWPSSLRVIDPPVDDGLVVETDDIPVAVDTLRRAAASRVLRLAGFGAAASEVSSLSSTGLVSEVLSDVGGRGRQPDLHAMIQRAQEQLENRKKYESLDEAGESYVGREIRFELATPIGVRGPGIRSLLLRYVVSVEFLDAIAQDIKRRGRQASTVKSRADPVIPQWHEMLGRARPESDQNQAIMRIGSSFFGEVRLLT